MAVILCIKAEEVEKNYEKYFFHHSYSSLSYLKNNTKSINSILLPPPVKAWASLSSSGSPSSISPASLSAPPVALKQIIEYKTNLITSFVLQLIQVAIFD